MAMDGLDFQKVRGNLLDITAQDLLGKSHEELVLLLIHLRRQSAALAEAIDGTRSELEQIAERQARTQQEEGRSLMGDLQVGTEALIWLGTQHW